MRPSTLLVAALLAALVTGLAPAYSAELPKRAMNDHVFRNAKGWLVFKGDVEPGWEHRNIQVYKRLCKGCDWNLVKKVKTDAQGRWRTRVFAPRTGSWYWKGLVPQADGYGASATQIWRTFVE
ncbi:MAG: hypothetical protein ABIO16_06340 [Nocardioides sp.]